MKRALWLIPFALAALWACTIGAGIVTPGGEAGPAGEGEGASSGEGEGASTGEGEGTSGEGEGEGEGEGTSCTPQCAGKQCGDDGCGGSCAPGCSGGDVCNTVTGVCAATCTPQTTCGANQCGNPPNGCGTGTLSCGACTSSTDFCDTTTFTCKCAPQCTGKQCSDDGCGGSCGACSGNGSCDASTGTCTNPNVSYASQVGPIFTASCGLQGCHAGAHPQQGLNLSTVSGAYTALVDKPASECSNGRLLVKPGDVANSYVVDKILGSNMCSGTQMPGGGSAALPSSETKPSKIGSRTAP